MGGRGGHHSLGMCNRVKLSPTVQLRAYLAVGMRKSLQLGRVDLEEVPQPCRFPLSSCLGQSRPRPALCAHSFSSFSPLHFFFPLCSFLFPSEYIIFLQKFLLTLRFAMTRLFPAMVITGISSFPFVSADERARLIRLLSAGLAGVLMRSCRERCSSWLLWLEVTQASAKEASTMLGLGGGAGEGVGTTNAQEVWQKELERSHQEQRDPISHFFLHLFFFQIKGNLPLLQSEKLRHGMGKV